jgi:hypothetical protein
MDGFDSIGRLVTGWFVILLAAVFGLGLLFHSEVDRRREKMIRVFDLAKEYRITLRSTSQNFADRWNEFYDDSVDTTNNNGNLTEQAYDDLVNRFLQADSNRTNYEALAGFYETVGECVKAGLCDFWYARTSFGNDIVTFYHSMYPQLQQEYPRGPEGMVDFVNRMRDADRGASRPGWDDRVASWAY